MVEIIGGPETRTRKPRYFDQVVGLAARIETGTLAICLPDRETVTIRGERPGPSVSLDIHDPDIFARIVRNGVLGFSEGYLDGQWDTDDLQGLMDMLYSRIGALHGNLPGAGLVRAFERLRYRLHANSRRQARRNIAHHYDLGNSFYRLWLDDTMTYSSGMFASREESLETAQRRKYARMVDAIGAKPGDHLLEIGCGWGGFAEYAARERGMRVTALTISRQQHDHAAARVHKAGLAERVDIRLKDYRDEDGRYDGIASIEMLEAVGEKYWPLYFGKLHHCLRPGAAATLQVITIAEDRFARYRRSVDFIQKYIFPGGMLPSPGELRRQARNAGLNVAHSVEFGEDYSQTLRRWYDRFNKQWDRIAPMGFDERFRRMWNLYLTSCAASFRSGNSDVTQFTVTRQA